MTRKAEINCYVVGSLCEQALHVDVVLPETCSEEAVEALAVAEARALAVLWDVPLEKIQVGVTILRTERKVEHRYDVNMSRF